MLGIVAPILLGWTRDHRRPEDHGRWVGRAPEGEGAGEVHGDVAVSRYTREPSRTRESHRLRSAFDATFAESMTRGVPAIEALLR